MSILISSIKDKNLREQLDELNEVTTTTGMPKPLPKKGEAVSTKKKTLVYWDDIKAALTGYARIIHYVNHSNVFKQVGKSNEVFGEHMTLTDQKPESLEVTMIQEGRFEEGKNKGYSRIITSDVENACQVGFFIDGQPKGKHAYFKLDGTFSQPEGLYEGDKLSTKIAIANFMQKISRT